MRDRLAQSLTVGAVAMVTLISVPTLAACSAPAGSSSTPGDAPGPAQSPAPGDPTGSGDSTSSTSAAGPGGPASQHAGSTGFGWVPFGPSDPGDPPPNRWYGPLAEHDCSALSQALADEPGGSLWEGLAAVCHAAIDGEASQWAVAKTKAAAARSETAPGATDPLTKCLDDAASALLARALAWHADHPRTRPSVTLPHVGQRTACSFRIDSVRLVDAAGNPISGALTGPTSGGTRLVIAGRGLGNNPTVLIAGQPATLVSTAGSGAPIIVTTPAVSHPLVGRIRVGNPAGQVLAPVTFRYVAPPGTSS